jgi:hypothetical protein
MFDKGTAISKHGNMKKILILLTVAVVSLTVSTLLAENSKGGTGILHFFVRKTMSNPGLVPDATGRIDAKLVRQGKANNQMLNIYVARLSANTPYQLQALVGDDTNFVQIAEFTTSDAGAAALHYRAMGKNGNSGLGHGKTLLPGGLNPISNIREIAITDTNLQAVLSADLTSPDKLQYLVKRTMTNDGVDTDAAGSLRIKGTTESTQFRLLASGLETNATYSLVINGNVDESAVANASGKLNFTTLLVNPIDILDVHTLSISDSASNSVLSTHLP